MTPKAQRLAIARACRLDRIAPLREMKGGWHYLEESHGGADTWAPVPLYLQDLNAMHEAEKVLTPAQYEMFCAVLLSLTSCEDPCPALDWITVRRMVSATAAQRAEAFLRTLNLWTP